MKHSVNTYIVASQAIVLAMVAILNFFTNIKLNFISVVFLIVYAYVFSNIVVYFMILTGIDFKPFKTLTNINIYSKKTKKPRRLRVKSLKKMRGTYLAKKLQRVLIFRLLVTTLVVAVLILIFHHEKNILAFLTLIR